MLDPRAIALQGVGYGALLLALQGFADIPVVVPPAVSEYSGGAGYFSRLNAKYAREEREEIRRQNDLVMQIAMLAVTTGMME